MQFGIQQEARFSVTALSGGIIYTATATLTGAGPVTTQFRTPGFTADPAAIRAMLAAAKIYVGDLGILVDAAQAVVDADSEAFRLARARVATELLAAHRSYFQLGVTASEANIHQSPYNELRSIWQQVQSDTRSYQIELGPTPGPRELGLRFAMNARDDAQRLVAALEAVLRSL